MTKSTTATATREDGTAGKPKRIVTVTPEMVAAASAQVSIAAKLGKSVPPAIKKIAELDAYRSRG